MEVVVNEHVLSRLMRDPDMKKRFPSLYAASTRAQQKTNCRSCKKSARARFGVRDMKVALVGLPSSQIAELKKVLNATSLVVYLPSRTGPRKVTLGASK